MFINTLEYLSNVTTVALQYKSMHILSTELIWK